MMVFWVFCTLLHQQAPWKIALYALLFSFSIEFSQFYHAPWIDEIRHTKLGGLVLGYAFKFTDLICYSTGIVMAFVIDHTLLAANK